MTQEQNVRTRGEQVITAWDNQADSFNHWGNLSSPEQELFASGFDAGYARGAEEARRKDAEGRYEAKDEGANYVLKSLASIFGRDGFYIRDGSESWEGDVHATLSKLLDDCGLTVEGEPSSVAGIDVDAVIRNVSELPDRTSPEGQSDLLMVTADELSLILSEAQPANVAVLEARVKELEADAGRFVWLAENTGCYWGVPGFGPVHDRSPSDRMNDLRKAIDGNIARAALKRDGGV